MAQQTRPDLHAIIEQRFPDNTSGEISPADVRTFLHALVDSAQLPATDGTGNLSPATTAALGGLIVGLGLKVDATGKVSLKIDSNTLGQQADGTVYVLSRSGNISPAATPTNVTAVRDHPRTETLVSWDAMADADLYQVSRQVNGGPWSLIATIPYPYYHDNSGEGQSDQFVLYRVYAANSAGQSPPSTITQAA